MMQDKHRVRFQGSVGPSGDFQRLGCCSVFEVGTQNLMNDNTLIWGLSSQSNCEWPQILFQAFFLYLILGSFRLVENMCKQL